MQKLLSTKNAARLLGVSPSTIKRWCDHDGLPYSRTSGGHRRFTVESLIGFRAAMENTLKSTESSPPAQLCSSELANALLEGDKARCHAYFQDAVCNGCSPEFLCDEVWGPCFVEIGKRWESGSASIYQERQACEIFERELLQVIHAMPEPSPHALVAMGAAPSGDNSRVPSRMIEFTLRFRGWKVRWLGADLPFTELGKAIESSTPDLFWLSVCHLRDPMRFLDEYNAFYERVGNQVSIAIGGRALTDSVRSRMKYTAFGDKVFHLSKFASILKSQQDERCESRVESASDSCLVGLPIGSHHGVHRAEHPSAEGIRSHATECR